MKMLSLAPCSQDKEHYPDCKFKMELGEDAFETEGVRIPAKSQDTEEVIVLDISGHGYTAQKHVVSWDDVRNVSTSQKDALEGLLFDGGEHAKDDAISDIEELMIYLLDGYQCPNELMDDLSSFKESIYDKLSPAPLRFRLSQLMNALIERFGVRRIEPAADASSADVFTRSTSRKKVSLYMHMANQLQSLRPFFPYALQIVGSRRNIIYGKTRTGRMTAE